MDLLESEQQSALLDLYEMEICKRLQSLNMKKADPLLKLLPRDILEYRKPDDMDFGRNLFQDLKTSPLQNNRLLQAFLEYFHDTNDIDMHNLLSSALRNEGNYFKWVLKNYDGFITFLNCDYAIEKLKRLPQYNHATKSIEDYFKEITDSLQRKRVILRVISQLDSYSVYHLMHIIQSESIEAKSFIEKLHPNFERYYNLLLENKQRSQSAVRIWPPDSNLETFLEAEKSNTKTVDLLHDNLLKQLLYPIVSKMYKETPLMLREYQKELCKEALSGENCIICAPTGTGKTVVAAYIIKQHLIKAEEEGPYGKVLFLVNNTTIIQQQADQLTKYLSHKYEVEQVCGSDNKPIYELILAKNVIVCTPQMIVNLLINSAHSGNLDFPQKSFTLDTFSMIVFDECHNTKKMSQYSSLMRRYHRTRNSGLLKRVPQIIGLTASLGVGTAKSLPHALDHIVRLCALMDCPTISLVRDNIHNLNFFSNPTQDELLNACDDGICLKRKEYEKILINFMKKLEGEILKILEQAEVHVQSSSNSFVDDDENERSLVYKVITKPPEDKFSADYLSWVTCHRQTIIPESPKLDSQITRDIRELLLILEILYRTLELCADFTTRDSLDYLKREIEDNTLRPCTLESLAYDSIYKQLENYATDECIMVSKVIDLLLDQNEKDFRAIIFIRTRLGALILRDLLNKCDKLNKLSINSEAISGFNAPTNATSRKEQKEILEQFNEGKIRVLVSTSVSEEGLDIPDCSLVVKYNYSTNEIAHIQRRGRGRAWKSRCILVTNNINIIKQEEKNIMKEILMKKAMITIKENNFDLRGKVNIEIRKLKEKIIQDDEEEKERIQQQKKQGIKYDLLCKDCENYICNNSEIMTHQNSQYLICRPDFWEECTITKEKEENQYCLASFQCIKCCNKLGNIMRIDSWNMPALKAVAFKLRYEEDGKDVKRVIRKWKDITKYFTPNEVTVYDLALMAKTAPLLEDTSKFTG